MSEWVSQTGPDYLFVDWGELKEGHDSDTNIVVKEGEFIEGVILEVKDHPSRVKDYLLKVKGQEKTIFIKGTTALTREMGYSDISTCEKVLVNDEVQIHYRGMFETKSGGSGYRLVVMVKRDKKK